MDRYMVYHICPPAPGTILNRYRSEWFRFGADRNDSDPGLGDRYGNMVAAPTFHNSYLKVHQFLLSAS